VLNVETGVLQINSNSNAFKVKYWEVGNEIWGDWVHGHSDANTYAQNFERYAAAMSASTRPSS